MADDKTIGNDEAKQIALRLITGAFRRDGEEIGAHLRPRFSIPCRPDHDDDTLLLAYIKQQHDVADELAEAIEIILDLMPAALSGLMIDEPNTLAGYNDPRLARARAFLNKEKDNG